MEGISAEVREFKKDVVELFSSICGSGVYTMKFHFLDHFVKIVKQFGKIAVLYASASEMSTIVIR